MFSSAQLFRNSRTVIWQVKRHIRAGKEKSTRPASKKIATFRKKHFTDFGSFVINQITNICGTLEDLYF